jgi:PAS domain S-box-containing protein
MYYSPMVSRFFVVFLIFLQNIRMGMAQQTDTSESIGSDKSMLLTPISILAIVLAALLVLLSIIYRKQKKMQAGMKETEKKLRQALAGMADIYYVIDRDYRIILINDIAEKQISKAWGVPVKAGDHILTLFPKHSKEPIRENFEKAFRGESVEYELHHTMPGVPEWVLVTIRPVMDEAGSITGACVVTKDITVRKETELQLRESELKIRSLVERFSDGFITLDKNFCFTYVNSRIGELVQRDPQSLIGKNIWEEFPDAVGSITYKAFQRAMLEMQYVSCTDYYAPLDLWHESHMYPSVEGLSVFVRDITNRKKAEEELQQAITRFELISRTTNDAIWEWDLETGKLWSNEPHQQLYGLTKADPVPVSQDWQGRIHPDDRSRILQAQDNALASGTNVFITEYRFLVHDKGYRDIYDRCYIVRNKEGKAIRMMGSMMEITERKRAEELVRSIEETMRLILNSALDAIITIDSKGLISLWTQQAENLFGWKAEEVTGCKLSQTIIPHRYREMHENGIIRFLQTGEGRMMNKLLELTALDKSGKEFPIELSITPVRQGDKVFFCSFIRDISERKRKEDEIKTANERFNTISRATNDVVWDWDLITNKLWWSESYFTNFGYTSALTPAGIESWYNGIHPDDKKRVVDGIYRAIEEGTESWADEYRFRKVDGTFRTIYDRGYIMRDEMGKAYRMIGAMVDITDVKKAQEELRLSEEKYRMLFKNNPMPMWVLDKETFGFLAVNEAALNHYGYGEKEFLKLSALDIRPEEEKQRFIESSREPEISKRRLYHAGIWKHKKKSGEPIDVEIFVYPVLYDGRKAELILVNDVTEKLKAEQMLKKSYEEIRMLASHLEHIRETERINIAREIHDELGQQLTVLKMDISWLHKKIDLKDQKTGQKMKDLLEMVDRTIRSVRKISSELRPSVLDDLGLVAALEWHSQEFEKRSGIKTNFKTDVDELTLPENITTGLFRIFQESLTNVARHAGAKWVHAELRRENGKLFLQIRDNGKGFDTKSIEKRKTLGILGMRERASLMGGEYHVESIPGKGTKIELIVPVIFNHRNENENITDSDSG